jgi:hypothetical protein
MFLSMFLPLIGGFVAVVLITVMIGWALDSSARRADQRRERH